MDAVVDYAKLLEDGNGFTQDIPKAIEYLRIGEAAGDPTALNNIAIHYLKGDYVEQNVPLAIDYFTRAAQAGNPMAMTNLGVAYRDGLGVEADPYEASLNMFIAELRGCEEATAEFDRMSAEGYGIFKKGNETTE